MSRKQKNNNPELFDDPRACPRTKAPPLTPRSPRQQDLITSLYKRELTFVLGPAGTGKTYIGARVAAEMLEDGEVERVIVTRPVVEAGENLGFLPGKPEDKFAPYFAPIREVLQEHFGGSHLSAFLKSGKIEIAPIAYMRGRSFKNSFVLLDEAQNMTLTQMKMFLTRLGEGSITCVSGDPRQIDIPVSSGLIDAWQRLGNIPEVGVVQFEKSDVVRSNLVQKIVESYE